MNENLPDNFIEKEGDLLDVDCGIICHQTNCSSNTWSGLAAAIFTKYPSANTYHLIKPEINGQKVRQVGEIDFFEVSEDKFSTLWIANINSQRHRGKANRHDDTSEMRIEWFKEGLARLSKLGVWDLYFPKNFGSALAGGDWTVYRQILIDFARDNPDKDIYIIELKKQQDL